MYSIHKYRILPALPKELNFIQNLAYNLYWTWDHDAKALFHRMDPQLWERIGCNPVLMLGMMSQTRLESLAKDDGFLSHLTRVKNNLENYMSGKNWYDKTKANEKPFTLAYFSMEYGLAKTLPIYSGGLGILAADHLKSASDLGLPLVAIGLLYQHGYFNQYLARDGWQQETYPKNDFYNLPIKIETDNEKKPLKIELDFPNRKVFAQIWRVQVGRVPLYLLDTNISENNPEDRKITDQLYGGDTEMRIKQEILLGIGGIRALEKLRKRPDVCHLNEGHSAFMALERIKILMNEHNLSFEEAREVTRGGNIFTSHTPVPAGIDEFDTHLIDLYLGQYYDQIKINQKRFFELGGINYRQTNGKFNMAIFALNMASTCNGVSRLHGQVARKMWNYIWPELPEHEVPIGHITNGIHTRTWLSEDMAQLFNRYLGPDWDENPTDHYVWSQIDQLPDEELWRTHERCRTLLVSFARKRLVQQLTNSNANALELEKARQALNPDALTIGFARRFAQYKRAYLLFKDLDRLTKIINDKNKPVQILFAGKAHPHDNIGKGILRDIINIIYRDEFQNKIVFLEDYDMEVASYLVQGVDIWLNTPRRPREASGTSGMKASANGALNLSVLDGWWEQAYNNKIGWAIGLGEDYTDLDEQDRVESEALYHLLEQEVVPLFYRLDSSGMPQGWIRMMKDNLKQICPLFNTNRMVKAYFQSTYLTAANQWHRLKANDMQLAKLMTSWKENITKNWNNLRLVKVEANRDEIKVGEPLTVRAHVYADGIDIQSIRPEIYFGKLDDTEKIETGSTQPMNLVKNSEKNIYIFEGIIPSESTGRYGFSIRVIPSHSEIHRPHEMGLIKWYLS